MKSKSSVLIAALALGACASGRTATIRADSSLAGGLDAAAKIDVPAGWYQTTSRLDRQEFVAPDNFSRIGFSTSPVTAQASACPALAQRAAESAAAELTKGQKLKVEMATAFEAPEVVDFTMTVPSAPPGPSDRLVLGRALCRDGALAVVSCSVGKRQWATLGRTCEQVVASLRVESKSQQAPAAAQPAANP